MRFNVRSLIVAALVILSTAVPAVAQEEADEDPLLVVPVGQIYSAWQLTYLAIASVPSPIAYSPPGLLMNGVGDRPGTRASATIQLALDRTLYAYDCGEERCVGTASEVWLALSPEQRQLYMDQVLDALVDQFPDRLDYAFLIRSGGVGSTPGSRVQRSSTTVRQDTSGNRTFTIAP